MTVLFWSIISFAVLCTVVCWAACAINDHDINEGEGEGD